MLNQPPLTKDTRSCDQSFCDHDLRSWALQECPGAQTGKCSRDSVLFSSVFGRLSRSAPLFRAPEVQKALLGALFGALRARRPKSLEAGLSGLALGTPAEGGQTFAITIAIATSIARSCALSARVGHMAGTFQKKFRKMRRERLWKRSQIFFLLEFPSRVRLGTPKPYNSSHLTLAELSRIVSPPIQLGTPLFFRCRSVRAGDTRVFLGNPLPATGVIWALRAQSRKKSENPNASRSGPQKVQNGVEHESKSSIFQIF